MFLGVHQMGLSCGLLFLLFEPGSFSLQFTTSTKGDTDHLSFSTSLKASRKSERLIRAVLAVSLVEESRRSRVPVLAVGHSILLPSTVLPSPHIIPIASDLADLF